MNRPAVVPPFQSAPTSGFSLTGSDTAITGTDVKIRSKSAVIIAGKATAEIECAGLLIEHSGTVHGKIAADTVRIKGSFEGSLSAKVVELVTKSRIQGDLTYDILEVGKEAIVGGTVQQLPSDRPDYALITEALPLEGQPSRIAADTDISGKKVLIDCASMLTIEGNVRADVKCESLVIEKGGSLTGQVTAEQFFIKGAFKGAASVTKVVIAGTARVKGNLEYDGLKIDDDATIDGTVSRRKASDVVPFPAKDAAGYGS